MRGMIDSATRRMRPAIDKQLEISIGRRNVYYGQPATESNSLNAQMLFNAIIEMMKTSESRRALPADLSPIVQCQ